MDKYEARDEVESGRQRLQYPRKPAAELERMRAIERLRQLTRDRDRYLDQAQEVSDAIRRIKDEHGITVESREPVGVDMDAYHRWMKGGEHPRERMSPEAAKAAYRAELHEALDRGMDKPLDGLDQATKTLAQQKDEVALLDYIVNHDEAEAKGIDPFAKAGGQPMDEDRPGDDSPLPDDEAEAEAKGIGPSAGGQPHYGPPYLDPDAWGHHG